MIQCFKCKQPIQPYERSIYASCGELAAIAHQRCVEQAQPEIQLLLIDLGDSTVVKAEKGEIGLKLGNGIWRLDAAELAYRQNVFACPFEQVRDAINGEGPVPRIEIDPTDGRYDLHYAIEQIPGEASRSMKPEAYQALCELAGKPLPIWEGGKWERLNTHDWAQGKKDAAEQGYGINAFSFEEAIAPVKIWRYTR